MSTDQTQWSRWTPRTHPMHQAMFRSNCKGILDLDARIEYLSSVSDRSDRWLISSPNKPVQLRWVCFQVIRVPSCECVNTYCCSCHDDYYYRLLSLILLIFFKWVKWIICRWRERKCLYCAVIHLSTWTRLNMMCHGESSSSTAINCVRFILCSSVNQVRSNTRCTTQLYLILLCFEFAQ